METGDLWEVPLNVNKSGSVAKTKGGGDDEKIQSVGDHEKGMGAFP